MLDITKKYEFRNQQNKEENDNFLKNLDISAYDIFYKFIRQSNRVCFLVKNDKIEYANEKAIKECGVNFFEDIYHEKFLNFVDKKYWEILATNIGEALTKDVSIKIKMEHSKKSIYFKALYLPDRENFSFILLAEPSGKNVKTEDKTSQIPSFSQLKDRLEYMINYETYKNKTLKKHPIAIVAIKAVNEGLNIKPAILDSACLNLVLGIKKNYCVAKNDDNIIFVLLNDIVTDEHLQKQFNHINQILEMPIKHKEAKEKIEFKSCYVMYPDEGSSSQKLIKLAIEKITQK